MDRTTLTRGIVEINDRLAATTPTEQTKAMFLCECGDCLGVAVPLSLEQFDELRAREEPLLARGHH